MTLIILGAGFSKGYNPDEIPVIDEFLDIAEKRAILKRDGEHKELIDFVEKYFGDYHRVNIETVASFLTTELVPDIIQKYEYREKLYRQLISIIIRTLGWLYDRPSNEEVKNTFQKFADKVVENGTNIITFNYDLILDNILKNTGNWSIVSGYGVKMKIGGIPPNLEKEIKQESKMSYLKLHGSLNWGRRIVPTPYGGKEIFISPFGLVQEQPILPIENMTSAETPRFENIHYVTFIVPPILSKEEFYRSPLLQNVWYMAKEEIIKSKEVFILGYSFPATDFLAEFLFRQSMASPFSANKKKIMIINKSIDEEYKERVENIFQKCEFEYKKDDVVKFLDGYTK